MRKTPSNQGEEKGINHPEYRFVHSVSGWQVLLKPEAELLELKFPLTFLSLLLKCPALGHNEIGDNGLLSLPGPDFLPFLEFSESLNLPPCHGGCYFFGFCLDWLFPEPGES